MIRVFIENSQYRDQIQYVFNTIFFVLGIKCVYEDVFNGSAGSGGDLCIVYCSSEFELLRVPDTINGLIFIKDSGKLFGEDYLKTDSIPPKSCIYRPSDAQNGAGDIISIYNDGEQLYICKDEVKRTIRTNIDIISDIFFMLTRYEEAVRTEQVRKDRHDRFPAMESLAYRNDFLHRPVVNEHIELLWSWIESFSQGYRRLRWWGQKSFAACLSHDVDHVFKNGDLLAACRHALGILLKFRKLKMAFDYLKNYFQNRGDHKADPYWTFNYITGIEKKYHFNSSFYFMSSEASDPDARYDISDGRIRELICELEACGNEVGYHGSLKSFNCKRSMGMEKNRLDGIVHNKSYGCRQHYLKFQIPHTWRCQQKSGLLYDTTLCYVEHEGFRCGMCFPYKPYDILEGKVLDIWEIPLTVMEGTLQSTMYRNLTPEEGLNRIISIIDTVKRYNGVFSLLWHNSSFDCYWEGWGYVFEETMKYLGASNCLGLSGRELVDYVSLYSNAIQF